MLIVGLNGTSLTDTERDWLGAPQVSGVLLFTRNFRHRLQLDELIGEIRSVRSDPLLVCIDQEGGPVCRIRGEGFVPLPALARIGELYDNDPVAAVELAERHAWLMASEMRALDIDLSFAPVVDLARGNRAIGERALHAAPEVVAELAQAYVRGMHLAGMAATVKHFPGHGSIAEDTHFEDATDRRDLDTLRAADLVPYRACFEAGAEAVMMAHVRYPAIDSRPAGYSPVWIRDVLRGELGFKGVVVSDDIAMAAAAPAGAIDARIRAHLEAGCDLVLVCKPDWTEAALVAVADLAPCPAERLAALRGSAAANWEQWQDNPKRTELASSLQRFAGGAKS